MATALLTINELGRQVEQRWLWRRLSFSLNAGERLAVRGPSGSGKTLLLRTLAGLDSPNEGNLELAGKPIIAWWMPRYRAQVLYLAQRPVLDEGTVESNLRLPFTLKLHRNKDFPQDRLHRYLERIGRDHNFLSLAAETLSGGESQLVVLLQALLIEPQVLLLDEPTASLDETTAMQVEELIDAWLEQTSERAVIWTSHQRAQLERVTTRSITLDGAM